MGSRRRGVAATACLPRRRRGRDAETTRGPQRRDVAAASSPPAPQATSVQSHAAPPPGLAPRSARLVVFNLGFLPWRARRDDAAAAPTTSAEGVVDALGAWALDALAPGGAASLAIYPQHPAGAREAAALRAFAAALSSSAWRATEHVAVNHAATAPFLLTVHRLYRDAGVREDAADDDFSGARAAAADALVVFDAES